MSNEFQFPPQTQQQRWIKYGSNVALVSLVAILLGAGLVWLAEKATRPWDTTALGSNSLKPQTMAVISSNKHKIEIISFYTKAKDQTAVSTSAVADDTPTLSEADKANQVDDLLESYRRSGANISVDSIDRVLNPGKANDLIAQVQKKYSKEIDSYKAFNDKVGKTYDSIIGLAGPEAKKLDDLRKAMPDGDAADEVKQVYNTVNQISTKLRQFQDDNARALKGAVPDYKKISDDVATNMPGLSSLLEQLQQAFGMIKDAKEAPEALKQYGAQNAAKYGEMKKLSDELIASQKKLGDLKLDTLKTALDQKNPILVEGETDWKVIPQEKVWKTDTRDLRGRGEGLPRPRFAGEQAITAAIFALNQPSKPKVCFVRNGGQPLADFSGELGSVADRLTQYGFDVTDKDLTGMFAMQAMQQQQAAPPEPTDADIEDAVWVVDTHQPRANPMMGGMESPSIAAKVAEHLAHGHHWEGDKKLPGGTALVLFDYHADPMDEALKDWGITCKTSFLAVHPYIKPTPGGGSPDSSVINEAKKVPYVFVLDQWGSHPVTTTLDGLPGVVLGAAVIQTKPATDVKSSQIIPLASTPPAWGAANFDQSNPDVKYDDKTDLVGPIFAGAAAEKTGGNRVIALGSEQMFSGAANAVSQTIVDLPDYELLTKKRILAPQFPGDAELFMNSIFWLSHNEPMIAISPSAMSVPRIGPMSNFTHRFWSIGVLLIGLPGLVLAAGVATYLSRRS